MIVDRRTNKDDVVFEQPGIDVVGPFAPARLLDDRGNERCGTRTRIVSLSHLKNVSARNPNQLLFAPLAIVSIRELL